MSITITEKQLFEYSNCPMKYDMIFNKKMPVIEQETLSKQLTKVSNFFFLNLLNSKILPNSELKKRWDFICKENDIQDSKKIMDGISSIMKFSTWSIDEKPVIVDINSLYEIQVNEVILKGNTGAVTSRNGNLELLIIDYSSKLPDQSIIDLSLKYTIDLMAFEKMHNQKINRIKIHSVKHNKDFYSIRNEQDIERAKIAIEAIGKSIELGIYYPRESFMCNQCSAKDFCKYWKPSQ